MSPFLRTALVFLGAGIGGSLRYWIGLAVAARTAGFPWGTFAINVSGSLLIGLAMGIITRTGANDGWRLLLVVGLLGGYTTFSSFSYEILSLLRERSVVPALGYAFGSVILGLMAAGLGLWLSELVGKGG
ncbi:fluoride efflux transporter CrcB [bacterium]|nr:MAG: fluoride efflux transporter CrcB [bacterium]